MATATVENVPTFDLHMSGPLAVSMLFHLIVVLLAITGLPYLKAEIPEIPDAITVEIVKADESPLSPPPDEKKHQPQQIEKPPEAPPRPPQMTADEPPKPVAPEKPEEPDLALPLEKAPEQVKKPEPKMAPPPKPVKRPMQTQEQPKEKQEDFKSLLKNLMPDEPTPSSPSQEKAQETSPLARFAQQMSMTEMQGLTAQLSQCWKLMSGARYAEDLIVEIKLSVNPDRTIRDAKIVNQLRYMSDSYFMAAADSALRAVWNPRCNPLDLPPNKYELWKEITVVFDPKEML